MRKEREEGKIKGKKLRGREGRGQADGEGRGAAEGEGGRRWDRGW